MSDSNSEFDPKGLIHESFQMTEISASECRSIFLDWALSLPSTHDTGSVLRALVDRYAKESPDHPMSAVLLEGLPEITTPKRRGGWRSRIRN